MMFNRYVSLPECTLYLYIEICQKDRTAMYYYSSGILRVCLMAFSWENEDKLRYFGVPYFNTDPSVYVECIEHRL